MTNLFGLPDKTTFRLLKLHNNDAYSKHKVFKELNGKVFTWDAKIQSCVPQEELWVDSFFFYYPTIKVLS